MSVNISDRQRFIKAVAICRTEYARCHRHRTGGSCYPGQRAMDAFPSFLETASKDIEPVW